MTEWVPVSWDAVKTGDTVRLEHEDGSVLVREAYGTTRLYIDALGTDIAIHRMVAGGWNLSVPAPTTPELEDGWYTASTLVYEVLDGKFRCASNAESDWWEPSVYAGAHFTRLEPAATTAKQIIDRIDAMRAGGEVTTLGQVQALLAAEFGVES